MADAVFSASAKVMARGQVTIPKDVREALGVEPGNRVTFVVEGKDVRLVNSAVYAMDVLSRQMEGEFEKAGLNTEEDIIAFMKKVRKELAEEQERKKTG